MSVAMSRREKKMGSYSQEGLEKLSEIAKSAREQKGLSLRVFAGLIGVSHGTIDRLEKMASDPQDETLMALAEVVPYTYVELKAIAQGAKPEDARAYVSAEDVLKIAITLEKAEQLRLLHMLLDHQQGS